MGPSRDATVPVVAVPRERLLLADPCSTVDSDLEWHRSREAHLDLVRGAIDAQDIDDRAIEIRARIEAIGRFLPLAYSHRVGTKLHLLDRDRSDRLRSRTQTKELHAAGDVAALLASAHEKERDLRRLAECVRHIRGHDLSPGPARKPQNERLAAADTMDFQDDLAPAVRLIIDHDRPPAAHERLHRRTTHAEALRKLWPRLGELLCEIGLRRRQSGRQAKPESEAAAGTLRRA